MTETFSAYPIIRTKLRRPPVIAEFLQRQRLLDLLAGYRKKPLTLVSAPAGYGKSMFVSHWLETCDIPSGWISLDENDSDLRVFAAYLVSAVEGVFPGACRKTQIMIHSPEVPRVEELASALLKELEQIEQPFIMVLDDYHLVKETSVHDLLTALLKHPLKSLHVVIIGRHDPPLPIFKLRAKSLVTEVRVNGLRFNGHETYELLKLISGKQVDSRVTATLTEKTEGWVTGLCLAAMHLRLKDDTEPIVLEQQTDAQYVKEYLFNEVLAKQPPRIRQFLFATAILDRFCAPLSEAVSVPGPGVSSPEHAGWDYINRLKKENLFLIPLDDEKHWFRFHHLFRSLLLNQLKRHYSTGDISALHARASAWFADNGMTEEAVRHALAAGDEPGAVQLIVQNRQAALSDERWFDLEKWLSILPDQTIGRQPELLLAQAYIHYFQFNYGLIPAIVDRVESLLGDHPQQQALSGEVSLLKAIVHIFQGNSALGLQCAEEALAQIPPACHFRLAAADQFWGLACQMQGQKERCVQRLTGLLLDQPLKAVRKIRVMFTLATVNILSGDLAAAFSMAQQSKSFAVSINSNHYIAWSSYLLGVIHFCRNELDLAIDMLSKAAELCSVILKRASVDCLGALALAYQAKQQADEADASIETLNTYVQSQENPLLLDIARSFAARLSAMRGEVPHSPDLSLKDKTSKAQPVLCWLELPDVTLCRVLLAAGSDSDLQAAERMLEACLRISEDQHNRFQRINILPLLASVYEKQGRIEEALTVLEEAVTMAAGSGFIRPFLESGEKTAGLLQRLAEKNIAVKYIGHILDAFSPPTPKPPSLVQTTDGQLTNREHDILALLSQRLQTKEISEKLFISTHTVNAHLKSVYRKLNVHNRRQAVAVARKLDFL